MPHMGSKMNQVRIVIAGATGNLGERIAKSLVHRGAKVVAMVRKNTALEKLEHLSRLGVEVAAIDLQQTEELKKVCSGASCVVSALAGLHDTIVDAQTSLLHAAVAAGVPRFIPSDYSADFTKLAPGSNRNFDLRREFHDRLLKAPIAATSIFNGAFMDMLTGQAPFILFKLKRVVYWQNANQLMEFTTIDDTASFTAAAAMDESSPRYLRIAGDQITATDLAKIASDVSGKKYGLLRAGDLKTLALLIKLVRMMSRDKGQLYPPWQGMQYMHNMYSGLTEMTHLDNQKYPGMKWTKVRDVLAKHLA
jgi:nucleoside-diphosphate-sugar epimerase